MKKVSFSVIWRWDDLKYDPFALETWIWFVILIRAAYTKGLGCKLEVRELLSWKLGSYGHLEVTLSQLLPNPAHPAGNSTVQPMSSASCELLPCYLDHSLCHIACFPQRNMNSLKDSWMEAIRSPHGLFTCSKTIVCFIDLQMEQIFMYPCILCFPWRDEWTEGSVKGHCRW